MRKPRKPVDERPLLHLFILGLIGAPPPKELVREFEGKTEAPTVAKPVALIEEKP